MRTIEQIKNEMLFIESKIDGLYFILKNNKTAIDFYSKNGQDWNVLQHEIRNSEDLKEIEELKREYKRLQNLLNRECKTSEKKYKRNLNYLYEIKDDDDLYEIKDDSSYDYSYELEFSAAERK